MFHALPLSLVTQSFYFYLWTEANGIAKNRVVNVKQKTKGWFPLFAETISSELASTH